MNATVLLRREKQSERSAVVSPRKVVVTAESQQSHSSVAHLATAASRALLCQEAECPKHLSWKKYKQQRGEESDNYLMDNENAHSTVIQL
uniref:Uncharacterized protein n=1 Tax=Caenorhabditis japonica TaxID=281687 RepID=A0A8R1I7M3_CAEJA